YPDLHGLVVSKKDMRTLRKAGVIGKGGQITPQALGYVKASKDPLLKLLYALCWKLNDELSKLWRLICGIETANEPLAQDVRQGIVLTQFGRHIASWPRR